MSEEVAWTSQNFAESSDAVEPDSLGSFPSESVAGEDASTSTAAAAAGIFLEPDVPKLGLTVSTPLNSTKAQEGSENVAVFEEDTRSSWNLETIPPSSKEGPPRDGSQTSTAAVPVDCDSQNSAGSRGRKRFSDDEITSEAVSHITADNLLEYQWPVDGGDGFMLQEQICEFLHVKSFKRKYPDLYRRPVEVDEKKYLREKGVVTETQCDLGLTALKADDVMDLIAKDYPDKYREYADAIRERNKQSSLEKHKGYSAASVEKSRMADFVRKAVASAAEYNQHLNQERKDERRSCFDMQTFTIQYPTPRKSARAEGGARRRYPVALIPGQYQDHYSVYTPQEMKYLPLNTVLYGPLQELGSVYARPGSDGSRSESEDSSDGSCSSSSGEGSSVSEPEPVCKVCRNEDPSKEKQEMISCSECGKAGHVACLDVLPEMAAAIKAYRWQCMDCKMCNVCLATDNEDKMMFCDRCDRGYHSFCVGMKAVPSGRWICRLCGRCSSCGAASPGPEGPRVQWHHEYGRGPTPADQKRSVTIFCQSCYRQRKGR